MSRVLLAMSGGVDSSVAAALLKEQGHEVIGLFMRHGQKEEACDTGGGQAGLLPIVSELAHKQGCCTAADAADARRVADKLEIPFYAVNFEEEFGQIIDYFVDEYSAGRTPNPCVVCNNWLKFGRLFDYADSVGAEFVATGHYARLTGAEKRGQTPSTFSLDDDKSRGGLTPFFGSGESPALRRGRDAGKDQSYVLFGIRRELLPRLMFPVGNYHKSDIRDRARRLGLRVADKKDSQEICFVTSGHYAEFVRRARGSRAQGTHDSRADGADWHAGRVPYEGEVVTTAGEVVGRHQGIENFTVGQRKGLGVALGEPYFVVRLERETRRVIIGRREELARTEFTAAGANWLIDEPVGSLRCEVKIRYLSQLVAATVEPLGAGRLRFLLDEPKHGVAPGQAAVCYDGDRVLGGAWIE